MAPSLWERRRPHPGIRATPALPSGRCPPGPSWFGPEQHITRAGGGIDELNRHAPMGFDCLPEIVSSLQGHRRFLDQGVSQAEGSAMAGPLSTTYHSTCRWRAGQSRRYSQFNQDGEPGLTPILDHSLVSFRTSQDLFDSQTGQRARSIEVGQHRGFLTARQVSHVSRSGRPAAPLVPERISPTRGVLSWAAERPLRRSHAPAWERGGLASARSIGADVTFLTPNRRWAQFGPGPLAV